MVDRKGMASMNNCSTGSVVILSMQGFPIQTIRKVIL